MLNQAAQFGQNPRLNDSKSIQASISQDGHSSYADSLIKDSKKSYQSAANGSIDTVNASTIEAKLKAKGVTTLKRVTLKKQTSAAS